jgi:hypothetical protein
MTDADWRNAENHTLGMLIDGDATDETDARGRPSRGDTLLLLLNGGAGAAHFDLPLQGDRGHWTMLVNTVLNTARDPYMVDSGGVTLHPFSMVLLRYGRERRAVGGRELSQGADAAALPAALERRRASTSA